MLDKYIGKTFLNSAGLAFIVLAIDHISPKHKHYKIRFLKSGYETVTTSSEINRGKIRDRLNPVVFGVGCLGYVKRANSKCRREYVVWHDMLNRCYNEKYPERYLYGGAGVIVCDRWLRFDYFLEDMKKLPGWDEALFRSGDIVLDKDRLSKENKMYSPTTCMWLSAKENHPLNNKKQKV